MNRMRLLAFALLAALAAVLFLWAGQGGERADAVIFSVTPAGNGQFLSGTILFIDVRAQDDAGALIMTASGGTNPILTVISCTASPPTISGCTGAITGQNSALVTIDTNILDSPDTTMSDLRVTLNLTATCASTTPISVTASQQDVNQKDIIVTATPAVVCTVPTPTPSFSGAANPAAVGCGGRAAILFGPIASTAAQPLFFTTTTGAVSPTSADYTGSGALSTLFTAPLSPIAQTATIALQTAAGARLGFVNVITTCGAAVTVTPVPLATTAPAPVATAAPARPTPPPPTPAPATPTAAPQTISPPNTGDGGLLQFGAGLVYDDGVKASP